MNAPSPENASSPFAVGSDGGKNGSPHSAQKKVLLVISALPKLCVVE